MQAPVPVLFNYAFRPFFLLVALHALVSVAFWSAWWAGVVRFEWQANPIYVHAHEMISGFAGAAIAGFLLTAVATWTKRPPVSGLRLVVLCALWLGGRLAFNAPLAYALFDIAWWCGLLLLMGIEVLGAGNRRNYKILGILALLLLSDAAYHAASLAFPALLQDAVWAQIWLVILMIAVIGGRIIPAFTGNWLRRQHAGKTLDARSLPVEFGRLDAAAIAMLVAFAVLTLLPAPPKVAAASGMLAAALHAWRLARWQGHKTLRDPLVWMLHLSYAWIPLGLALMAAALIGLIAPAAGLHAFGAGAIAGMIVSVSARAALGHTNRPLLSHPLLTTSIVLLAASAGLRIAAALYPQPMLLAASVTLWIAAFLCYAARYGPILLRSAALQD
jgi:uncharacterized protein involved in response to NO